MKVTLNIAGEKLDRNLDLAFYLQVFKIFQIFTNDVGKLYLICGKKIASLKKKVPQ